MEMIPFRSYALISREQIARNYRNVRAAVGPDVNVLGVVKADAYGHGILEVARILIAEGARWLAVSSVDEGVRLREAGIGARILVMAGFLRYEGPALAEHDLTSALHSLDDIEAIDELARTTGKTLRYHLKIDSGMGRLGTRAEASEILEALSRTRHAQIEGLMTHFASAADYSSTQTDEQVARFESIRAALVQGGVQLSYVHTSSTNAIGYGRREAW